VEDYGEISSGENHRCLSSNSDVGELYEELPITKKLQVPSLIVTDKPIPTKLEN